MYFVCYFDILEVEKDGQLVWCPTPGCETICHIIQESNLDARLVNGKSHKSRRVSTNKSLLINCITCRNTFCAECKLSYHPGISCESFRRKLIKQGKLSVDDEELFALDCIKKCPFCQIPIEKDSGCAQMMCKKCKHVFCWYCLASLDVSKKMYFIVVAFEISVNDNKFDLILLCRTIFY
jgi:E3 ubiquitin-protein ligase RNF144